MKVTILGKPRAATLGAVLTQMAGRAPFNPSPAPSGVASRVGAEIQGGAEEWPRLPINQPMRASHAPLAYISWPEEPQAK